MQQRHKRNKTTYERLDPYKFHMQLYAMAQNPETYIHGVLVNTCLVKGINKQKMNIKQFQSALQEIPVKLKSKQLHELYLYATYDNNIAKKTNQKKAFSIVNLQAYKINLLQAAKWIQKKLEITKNQTVRQKLISRQKLESFKSGQLKKTNKQRLPIIKTRPTQRFASEVSKVLDIFSQMQKQRQNAGLQPICISSDEQENRGEPTKQIHYDGDFFEVNQKLFKLRQQAKFGIYQIIQAAKHDKKLKQKFEDALVRYQRVRTQATQKNGRCGAMKAQKRIFDKQKQQINKIQRWRQKTNQSQFTTKQY